MSVSIGRMPPGDQELPLSPTGDTRALFLGLSHAYAAPLFDYAQELVGERGAAAETVESALSGAIDHLSSARLTAAHEDGSLRPWLYAAVRHECGVMLAAGAPGRPAEVAWAGGRDDPPSAGARDPADRDEDGPTDQYEVAELAAEERRRNAAAVAQVLSGLSADEVELLSLAIRHGLADDELADVLAVTSLQAGEALTEALERFEQQAVAIVLLNAGWSGCRKLDEYVGGAYQAPDSDRLVRRIVRHSRSCAICGPIVGSRALGPDVLTMLPVDDLPRAVELWLRSVAPAPGTFAGEYAALADPAASAADVAAADAEAQYRAEPHADALPAEDLELPGEDLELPAEDLEGPPVDDAEVPPDGPGQLPARDAGSAVADPEPWRDGDGQAEPAAPSRLRPRRRDPDPVPVPAAAVTAPASLGTRPVTAVEAVLATIAAAQASAAAASRSGAGTPGAADSDEPDGHDRGRSLARPGWLTRPLAGTLSVVAVVVIVGGAALAASQFGPSAPPRDQGHSTSISPTSGPGSSSDDLSGPAALAPSGLTRSSAQPPALPGVPRSLSSMLPPAPARQTQSGPSRFKRTTEPVVPKPGPSTSKPRPKPSSAKPTTNPPTSAPPSSTPTDTPTPTPTDTTPNPQPS